MIRLSVLYPERSESTFDMDYYLTRHIPMTVELLSSHPGFKGITVEKGVSGAVPGVSPRYIALCHISFASTDDFLAAFMPHAQRIQSDGRNYSSVEPVVQISEVLVSR